MEQILLQFDWLHVVDMPLAIGIIIITNYLKPLAGGVRYKVRGLPIMVGVLLTFIFHGAATFGAGIVQPIIPFIFNWLKGAVIAITASFIIYHKFGYKLGLRKDDVPTENTDAKDNNG